MEKVELFVLEEFEIHCHGKSPTVPDRKPPSAIEKQFWEHSFGMLDRSRQVERQETASILR